MENNDTNKLMGELTLALIYLTAWKEKDDEVYRSWKGYDFGVLEKLKERGLIDFAYNAKPLSLSEEGAEKAKQLIKKLSKIV